MVLADVQVAAHVAEGEVVVVVVVEEEEEDAAAEEEAEEEAEDVVVEAVKFSCSPKRLAAARLL